VYLFEGDIELKGVVGGFVWVVFICVLWVEDIGESVEVFGWVE